MNINLDAKVVLLSVFLLFASSCGFVQESIKTGKLVQDVDHWNSSEQDKLMNIEQKGHDSVLVTWKPCLTDDLKGYFVYMYEAYKDNLEVDIPPEKAESYKEVHKLSYVAYNSATSYIINNIHSFTKNKIIPMEIKFVKRPICSFVNLKPKTEYYFIINAVSNNIQAAVFDPYDWNKHGVAATGGVVISEGGENSEKDENTIKENLGTLDEITISDFIELKNSNPKEYENRIKNRIISIKGTYVYESLSDSSYGIEEGSDKRYYFFPGLYYSRRGINEYFFPFSKESLEIWQFGIREYSGSKVFNMSVYGPNICRIENRERSDKRIELLLIGEERIISSDSMREVLSKKIKEFNEGKKKSRYFKGAEENFYSPKYLDKNGNYHYFHCLKIKILNK